MPELVKTYCRLAEQIILVVGVALLYCYCSNNIRSNGTQSKLVIKQQRSFSLDIGLVYLINTASIDCYTYPVPKDRF